MLTAGLAAGNIDGRAVNVSRFFGREESNGICNLGELAGTTERCGAGFAVARTELFDGNAACVRKRFFVRLSAESGCLKYAGGDAHNSYVMFAEFFCP